MESFGGLVIRQNTKPDRCSDYSLGYLTMHEHVVRGTFGLLKACPLIHQNQNKGILQGACSFVGTILLASRVYLVLIVGLTNI